MWNVEYYCDTAPVASSSGLLLKFFSSDYQRECTLSTANIVRSECRSCLTDDRVDSCLMLAVGYYTPKFTKLVESMQRVIHLINLARFSMFFISFCIRTESFFESMFLF